MGACGFRLVRQAQSTSVGRWSRTRSRIRLANLAVVLTLKGKSSKWRLGDQASFNEKPQKLRAMAAVQRSLTPTSGVQATASRPPFLKFLTRFLFFFRFALAAIVACTISLSMNLFAGISRDCEAG